MKFCLRIVLLLFLVTGTLTDDGFGFNLEDAFGPDPTPKPDKPAVKPPPSGGGDGFGFNLEDAFGPDPTPKPDKPAVKPPPSGGGGGFDLEDAFGPDPTPKPNKPAVKPPSGGGGGLDLEDALGPDPNPKPDKPAVKPPSGGGGGGSFDDGDLFDVTGGDYKPEGGRPGGGHAGDPGYDPQGGADQPQEAGSGQIAGIVSAIGVALMGAASSYIAYQKKKLCFKLQGGADPESGKGHHGNQSDPQVFSNLLRTS